MDRAQDWEGVAAAYDASFGRLCAGAVEALLDELPDGPPGARFLDVGTGTGSLAAAAAGRGFRVDGIDSAPTMVEAARRKVSGARFTVGDAALLPWPDATFCAVGANFVLNHVSDPAAAVRELRRVCGGRIAATIWPAEVGAMNALFNRVVEESGVVPVSGTRLPPDRDFPRTPEGLAALLRSGGFEDARAGTIAWELVIAPADLWLAVEAGIAVIGRTFRAQDAATRDRMRVVWGGVAVESAEDGVLRLPAVAVLGSGQGG